MPVALVLVVVVVLIFAGIGVATKRRIARMDGRCQVAWNVVEEQFQRRDELVPQFVEMLEVAAPQEDAALAEVLKARKELAVSTKPEARMAVSANMSGALNLLVVASGAYPALGDDARFQQVLDDLSDTETKLGYAIASYNECVEAYNATLANLPGKIVAGSRFRVRKGFEGASDTVPRPLL